MTLCKTRNNYAKLDDNMKWNDLFHVLWEKSHQSDRSLIDVFRFLTITALCFFSINVQYVTLNILDILWI